MPESSISILELRNSVKRWEREFEASAGRKPSSSDAKANPAVWKLYQQYRACKKSSSVANESVNGSKEKLRLVKPPSTPQKPKNPPSIAAGDSDGDTENDETGETPSIMKVTEVFPTPQFRGKVLGLFDVELNPLQTPQKLQRTTDLSSSSPNNIGPQTPTAASSEVTETPQSKRTPEYFLHRVNLFCNNGTRFAPDESNNLSVTESPLIKRKSSRTKPVCEIMREASLLMSSPSRSSSVLAEGDDNSSSSDDEGPDENGAVADIRNIAPPALNGPIEPGNFDMVPIMDPQGGSRRKRPKRQTKRVIMRPINESSELSTAKATDNYVRLKINNKNKRPMRRR